MHISSDHVNTSHAIRGPDLCLAILPLHHLAQPASLTALVRGWQLDREEYPTAAGLPVGGRFAGVVGVLFERTRSAARKRAVGE